jgi:uncharacterized protein HemY
MKKRFQLVVLSLAVPVLVFILFTGIRHYADSGEYKTGFSQKERIERANNQIRSILPLWKLISRQLLPQG